MNSNDRQVEKISNSYTINTTHVLLCRVNVTSKNSLTTI